MLLPEFQFLKSKNVRSSYYANGGYQFFSAGKREEKQQVNEVTVEQDVVASVIFSKIEVIIKTFKHKKKVLMIIKY